MRLHCLKLVGNGHKPEKRRVNPSLKDQIVMQSLVKFEDAMAYIKRGEKLPNGVYAALSKEQKKTIRETRLSTAIEMTPRMLSAELVKEGWRAESVVKEEKKGGVMKATIQLFKRPVTKPDAAQIAALSDDELVAEIARREQAKQALTLN